MCKMSFWEIWHIIRNFLKNVKKNMISFKLFWHKGFVHWKLKLLSFLMDSVLNQLLSFLKNDTLF